MAYNEILANRVRGALADLPDVVEKTMFSGICFMVDGKMCICVSHDDLLCRIGQKTAEEALEKNGTRVMVNNGRTMKDYVYVNGEELHSKTEFDYWVNHCLAFNKFAKASKPKSKK